MMLKYFKLSFSIRLLWQSRDTPKSPMFAICFASCPTAVDALTQLYLRQVARKAPMQSEKQKSRSQNSGDFVFYIEFSLFDFSQLLRRKSIKTHCRIAYSQRKNDNFPQRHSPFRYLYAFCRHISLYDTFECLTWLTVVYCLCFRYQSVNVTITRIRLGTTNV